ncbi:SHOCT domain-containing protein [Streptomyces sp. NPDC046805]|uniref:SHOCT domain-containing protein n=1 Tax=Streptomyces sp. NPDC046805 TaxID=3155134 RepID=UPI0033EC0B38
MPGLLRGVARTAVISGTATAVSNRVSRRQAGRWAQQDAEMQERERAQAGMQAAAPAQPAPSPAAPPPGAADDMGQKIEQLKQLGELKAQGVLTDEEFEVQKRRIIG